jgi:hypothetical protein
MSDKFRADEEKKGFALSEIRRRTRADPAVLENKVNLVKSQFGR